MTFLQQYQKLVDQRARPSAEYFETYNDTGTSKVVWDSSYSPSCVWSSFLSKCTDNYYCHRNISCDNCYDCDDCFDLTNSYMSYYASGTELFYCKYCQDCKRCDDCMLCFSCEDCFGCYGLMNEKYCIFNKRVSEQEYQTQIQRLRQLPKSEIQSQFESMLEKVGIIGKIELGGDSEDSVFTSESWNNTSCFYCFGTYQSNNSMYCFDCESAEDSVDNTILVQSQNCFSCIYCFLCNECFYCFGSMNCAKSAYLENCSNCIECFGCVGLKDKQYCILNIQYTADEYTKAILNIKNELGWRV